MIIFIMYMLKVVKNETQIKAYDWINFVQDQGAGEILLNSIDMDGSG